VTPFEHIVAEHGPTVLKVCRAVVGPVDADDAWVETFISALRAYPKLAPGSNLKGWLVTIAHRKALDVRRARGRAPIPTPRVAEDLEVPAAVPPDDGLWLALDALPPRQRDAVTYHHVAGLPYREVATLTKSTPAAVRRAAADGLAALRVRLKGSV
jgi:RNA polymerase sigma factor (sigma-70 family)